MPSKDLTYSDSINLFMFTSRCSLIRKKVFSKKFQPVVTAFATEILMCFPDIYPSLWGLMTSFGRWTVNKMTWVTSRLRKLEALVPSPLSFPKWWIGRLHVNGKVQERWGKLAYFRIYIRGRSDKQKLYCADALELCVCVCVLEQLALFILRDTFIFKLFLQSGVPTFLQHYQKLSYFSRFKYNSTNL